MDDASFRLAPTIDPVTDAIKPNAATAVKPREKSRAGDTHGPTRLPRDIEDPDFLFIAQVYAIPIFCQKFDLFEVEFF